MNDATTTIQNAAAGAPSSRTARLFELPRVSGVTALTLAAADMIGTGVFTYGIVNDNDQEFVVERAGNRGSSVLQNTANWPIGAFLYPALALTAVRDRERPA